MSDTSNGKNCLNLINANYWLQLLQNMTSPEYGEYIRSRINDTHTQDVEYYEPSFDLELNAGTAHLSVFGPDGSAVAMTSTINL